MKEAYQIKEIRENGQVNGSVLSSDLDKLVMSSPEVTYNGRPTDTAIPWQAWNPLPGIYAPPIPPPIMPPQSPGMPGYPGYGPNVFDAGKNSMPIQAFGYNNDDFRFPVNQDFELPRIPEPRTEYTTQYPDPWQNPIPCPDVIPPPSPRPVNPEPTPYPHP